MLPSHCGSFRSSLRRTGLNSGFGAMSGSLSTPAWLAICPGSFSGCSTTPGISVSISRAILFRKFVTLVVVSTLAYSLGKCQLATYRFDKPPGTSKFKPTQMTTPRGSHHDTVRCLGNFFEGQAFATSNLLTVSKLS